MYNSVLGERDLARKRAVILFVLVSVHFTMGVCVFISRTAHKSTWLNPFKLQYVTIMVRLLQGSLVSKKVKKKERNKKTRDEWYHCVILLGRLPCILEAIKANPVILGILMSDSATASLSAGSLLCDTVHFHSIYWGNECYCCGVTAGCTARCISQSPAIIRRWNLIAVLLDSHHDLFLCCSIVITKWQSAISQGIFWTNKEFKN